MAIGSSSTTACRLTSHAPTTRRRAIPIREFGLPSATSKCGRRSNLEAARINLKGLKRVNVRMGLLRKKKGLDRRTLLRLLAQYSRPVGAHACRICASTGRTSSRTGYSAASISPVDRGTSMASRNCGSTTRKHADHAFRDSDIAATLIEDEARLYRQPAHRYRASGRRNSCARGCGPSAVAEEDFHIKTKTRCE